jgi:hypothetical protein
MGLRSRKSDDCGGSSIMETSTALQMVGKAQKRWSSPPLLLIRPAGEVEHHLCYRETIDKLEAAVQSNNTKVAFPLRDTILTIEEI